MICKIRETKTDTFGSVTEVAKYRDGKKWVGVFAAHRGGCLYCTSVVFRNLANGEQKTIGTTGMITDNVGDSNAYYAGLYEKHMNPAAPDYIPV